MNVKFKCLVISGIIAIIGVPVVIFIISALTFFAVNAGLGPVIAAGSWLFALWFFWFIMYQICKLRFAPDLSPSREEQRIMDQAALVDSVRRVDESIGFNRGVNDFVRKEGESK